MRDRGGGYGKAVAKALPDAIRIVDRWHLMENASAAAVVPRDGSVVGRRGVTLNISSASCSPNTIKGRCRD
jgi:transposase